MTLITGNAIEDIERWEKPYKSQMVVQHAKENTLTVYGRVLRKFKEFIDGHDSVAIITDIKKPIILEFIQHLEKTHREKYPDRKGFSSKTKSLYITVLKTFFDFISNTCDPDRDTGLVYSFNREFDKIFPKDANKKKKPKHLTDKEYENLMDYLSRRMEDNPSHYDYIHSLGIKLMIHAGLRITEMLNLTLDDFMESTQTNEKGERDFYEIFLSETKSGQEQEAMILKEAIQSELDYFESIIGMEDYIFKGLGSSQRIDRSNFYRTIKKIYEKAGIRRKGLHILRHTSAMRFQEKTDNVLLTQMHLRHAGVATTMVYVGVGKKELAMGLRK